MEQWKQRILRVAAALALAAMILTTMQSSQLGYLLVEVCLLFGVLFCGYRYGPETGALIGSISGMLLALWSGQIAQLGILCLLGVFSGAFRRLGRMASMTAYVAAAFGVGLLYAQEELFTMMKAVLAGGFLFLLLPHALLERKSSGGKGAHGSKHTGARVPCTDYDGSLGGRLSHAVRGFYVLSGLYREELPKAREGIEEEWRQRYLELRLLMAEQTRECAQLLEEVVHQLKRAQAVEPEKERAVREQLARCGIRTEQMVAVEGKGHHGELLLTLSCEDGTCRTMGQVLDCVSEAIGIPMQLLSGQSSILSAVPRTVHMEEMPRFYLISGSAQARREGVSGDSFSAMEIPGGSYFFALCDGMGCGERAGRESQKATEFAEELIRSGFPPMTVIRLLNHALLAQGREHPLTMDAALVDAYTGVCDLVKSGAAVTFLCRRDRVEILSGDSLPVGILVQSAPTERMVHLHEGEYLVMMTDGVLEALPVEQKEEAMRDYLAALKKNNPRQLAEEILDFVSQSGEVRDDMTVLAAGIWRK